jgi:uncharacterized caspase-like protein
MKRRVLYPVLIVLLLALGAHAAPERKVNVKPKNTSQTAEHRIALVIGNSSYRVGALRNPANDARAIAATLRSLDFEVDEQINLSYQEMGRAVNRFGKSIRHDSVALFYYAGHGLQVQGNNYLVPVDMEIQDEGEVQFNTVNAGQVLAKMEEAKNPVNIVILDACRDNPYARSFKRSSTSRGLAPMDAPVGSFVAYAAAPGKTAADGTGINGLYTESLIRQIKNPGMRIEDVFKRVRTEVRSKSNGSQVPEERSSLEGDFYFMPQGSSHNNLSDVPSYATKSTPQPDSDELARQKEALERERQALAKQKQELERQKVLDAEREQLAAERRKIEAERQQLAKVQRPSAPTAGEIGRDGRFIAYSNGTVLDTKTNLMWASKDNGSSINWANAKSYCENYGGGGYSDWRMPTQDELAGLYDRGTGYRPDCAPDDAANKVHLTNLITLSCWVGWASERRDSAAAYFNFGDNLRWWYPQSFDAVPRALPVRNAR